MIIIGVDTGGTFTDFIYKKDGKWHIYKTLSTPENPAIAVLKGIKHIGQNNKKDITHGSTVATNAVLERKGAKTAFITNKGFEDIIYIGRQNRKELYNLFYRRPEPLVEQKHCYGINCRVNSKGEIIQEIDENEINQIIQKLKQENIQSVAVSFLFSFLNPEHEKILKEKLIQNGLYVTVSHELIPEFREYERSSTVVINSYVMPKMNYYISYIQENLLPEDQFRIIQSNGGVIAPEVAKKEPVRTVLSGPAGGVVGAYHIGQIIGQTRLITFDMGGTSTDVALIDGQIPFSTESTISDFPIKVPVIDIHTVGAGGGSIAYLDEGGALNVGPESAGADPGPICYGKGEKITVTDANLITGRLLPDYFLGGKMKLDYERTYRYFEKYAQEWDIPVEKLAEGVLTIANTKMENAIRKISIERGHNPKDFALFVYGGAGGLHAAFLAKSIGIPKVIIPKNPGIFSAFGMLLSDIVKDYSLTVLLDARENSFNHLNQLFETLKEKAITDLKQEGIDQQNIKIQKILDMRYKGQSFEIFVPFSEKFIEDFHNIYEKNYGYKMPDKPVQIVNIRLRATGYKEKPEIEKIIEGTEQIPQEAIIDHRPVIFDGKEYKTAILNRDKLLANNEINSPAIIVEYSSTTVVPPFAKAIIDLYGNIIIEV
ncbi:hydantoinase/oxoprolinase family protein [Persephonella sp. KM09-Lau-8]|uniref:hydantoinase/oxoprolinase family protein n=1 Tax=Persephonella sp. KM09-Lau-8 TaxID=1158345 RepID=UPI000497F920|nr:hydantoinase/oxoprolinase family protein [Persephonella sp. KM09-Lau-8]